MKRMVSTIHQFLCSRIFRRYALSYLLMFLLPMLLISNGIFYASSNVLSEYIYDTQMSAVKQARRALDFEARRYNTIATVLLNDVNMQKVIDVDESDMFPEHALSIQKIRKSIDGSLSGMSESTENIKLYLQENGYVIDPIHGLPLKERYANLSPQEYLSEAEVLTGQYSQSWQQISDGSSTNVCYASTLSNGGVLSARMTFMACIRSSYLNDLLHPLSTERGEWAAVYGSGEMIYQSGRIPVEMDWTKIQGTEGQFETDGYLFSYIRSEVTNDYFVNAIASHELLLPLNSLHMIMLILMCVCFAVCCVLSYVLAARNFNPLRSLVALTSGSRNSDDDEYAILRSTLLEAADERRRLLSRATMDERLKHDYTAYKKLRLMDSWQELPNGGEGSYCFAQIVLIDYTDNCAPTEAMMLIRDVFDFERHEFWQTETYQQGNELMMLVHLEKMVPTALNEVVECLKSAVQIVRDNYAADCLVGLSSVRDTREPAGEAIRKMEIEAHAALRAPVNGQAIHTYQADEMLDRAFRRMMAAASKEQDPEVAIEAFTKEARELLSSKVNKEDGAEYSLKQQVIDIVQKQYADPSLNVSQIAAQLGRSADYVSKVFKQTTLIGMLDYIHHTRVSAAKLLLVERKEMNISEVSATVGYVSVDSFIRAFKRIYGVTPGEYRKNAMKSENADVQKGDLIDS